MYDENETAQIKATPVKGYRFVKWSDGVENAERNLSVTDDFSLIAIFEKDGSTGTGNGQQSGDNTNQTPGSTDSPTTTKYQLNVTSNDVNMGTVSGAGQYAKDSQATVKATPKSGYLFDQWSDGNKNAERTVTVSRDNMSLVATFYQEGTQRPSEVEPELPPTE